VKTLVVMNGGGGDLSLTFPALFLQGKNHAKIS
jgi:hypothetical protein